MHNRESCKWIYRPGTDDSHWAIAACDKSHKYLSKIPHGASRPGIANFYNGRLCPSCDHPIQMDYSFLGKGNQS